MNEIWSLLKDSSVIGVAISFISKTTRRDVQVRGYHSMKIIQFILVAIILSLCIITVRDTVKFIEQA
jgi:multisubunit Na+/H+ antiporter MnhE subunit